MHIQVMVPSKFVSHYGASTRQTSLDLARRSERQGNDKRSCRKIGFSLCRELIG